MFNPFVFWITRSTASPFVLRSRWRCPVPSLSDHTVNVQSFSFLIALSMSSPFVFGAHAQFPVTHQSLCFGTHAQCPVLSFLDPSLNVQTFCFFGSHAQRPVPLFWDHTLNCHFFHACFQAQCPVLFWGGHTLNVQSFRFRITRSQFSHCCFSLILPFCFLIRRSVFSPFVFKAHSHCPVLSFSDQTLTV